MPHLFSTKIAKKYCCVAIQRVLFCLFSRADYWKSQARKYCDFCKCWIADNRPSIDFHEKGRRHKENVAKKLKYITKKSRRDEAENVKVDAALAAMESAALEAYRKDVQNNADLTSKAINEKLESLASVPVSTSNKSLVWREAKTDCGKTYYWNSITNESVWEAPKEFQVIPTKDESEYKHQIKQYQKQQNMHSRIREELDRQEKEEERARVEREKLKSRCVEPLEPVVSGPLLPEGKNDPYGQWKTVQVIPREGPVNEFECEEEAPSFVEEPPRKEFKEKTVESLGACYGEEVQFKKRKFGAAAKRNCRARLDDD